MNKPPTTVLLTELTFLARPLKSMVSSKDTKTNIRTDLNNY